MLSVRNVVLGVSGGVDSCVAGVLLKSKGFNVTGVFMRNWDLADENGACTLQEDYEDAKYICNRLKIPFCEVDFVKEYWNEVFSTLISEYEGGTTPNPDVLCNRHIKFDAFFNHATRNLNADAIATGHYAKTSFGDFLENYQAGANARLFVPKDQRKDQTLFLSQIPQESLRRTMFPLAGFTKEEVKKIAVEHGLGKIASKPESTGICFIGRRNFAKFISDYVRPKPGQFVDLATGRVVGTHEGIHFWTIGQKIGIRKSVKPYYIVQKIKNTSDMYVAEGRNHPAHFSCMFFTHKPYWIADPPDLTYLEKLDFRFQHARPLTKCTAFKLDSGNLFTIVERPLRALTPGQYAVYYKDDECLGSAVISHSAPTEFSLGNEIPDDYAEYEEKGAFASGH